MIIDSGVVTGSLQVSGSLTVTGSSNLQGNVKITGSLTVNGPITGAITGSITNAISASFAETAAVANNANDSISALSSSYSYSSILAQTASLAPNYLPLGGGTLTGSLIINSGNLVVNGTASITYLVTTYESASVIFSSGSNVFGDALGDNHQFTGSVTVTGSLSVNNSSVITSAQTSSISVFQAQSASVAGTANNALTASFVQTAQTASYVLNAVSASRAISAQSADNATTASFVANAVSASRATTAANADNATNAATASIANNALTASYVPNALTASYVVNALSASYSPFALTSSYALVSATASSAEDFVVRGLSSFGGNVINGVYQMYVTTSINDGTLGLDTSAAINAMYLLKSGLKKFEISLDTTNANPIFRLLPYTSSGFFEIGNPSNAGSDYVFISEAVYGNVMIGPGIANATTGLTGTLATDKVQIKGDTFVSGGLKVINNSTILGNEGISGSLSVTGSLNVVNGITGSLFGTATNAVSASYATTASYAVLATNANTASFVTTAQTASYVLNAVSASYATTAPFYVLTASYNTNSSSLSTRTTNLESTASTLTTASASFVSQLDGIAGKTGSYATTASNTFTGTQYTSNNTNATSFTSTAALYTDGGLRVTKDAFISGGLSVAGNFTVYGTSSVNYITSSTLLGLEFLNLNTDLPALRYAGINVGDSGSAAGVSSSFWYDSTNDDWIFVHSPAGSSQTTSSIILTGPAAYNNVGNEVGITGNYLVKGQSIPGDTHHITSSQIFDDGTTVAIAGNLQVTGSFRAANLTGSLNGSNLIDASVANAKLTNSSVTVTAGTGMSGGGAVALGSSVTLTNAGVTSAVAGTGVGVSAGTGAVTISIGQAVATNSNVQFNSLGVGTAGSGTTGEIRATADITAYYSSDERLKEDITPIENPIEKLMAINGVTFNWKEGFDEVHSHKGADTGVIAQQIEAIGLPDTVNTRENGYKAVRYEKLNALLIEGFKAQQGEINELKELVKALLNK